MPTERRKLPPLPRGRNRCFSVDVAPAILRLMKLSALGLAVTAACAVLTACDGAPIAWDEPAPTESPSTGPAGVGRVLVDSAGRARLVADSAPATPAPETLGRGICANTMRVAEGAAREFAVWWGLRGDSTAVLYASASPDRGTHWEPAMIVDSAGAGGRGCGQRAPALATLGDDLHVAYSMTAPEGAGVFFAHFMGSMFHSPVPVIYGDRTVATAIAVDGARVAVAYEQPNGRAAQVGISVSGTQGHLFEIRVDASRSVDDASDPLVALAGHTVAVSWVARRRTQGADGQINETDARMIRVGRIAR
jgi:hypothetical protein